MHFSLSGLCFRNIGQKFQKYFGPPPIRAATYLAAMNMPIACLRTTAETRRQKNSRKSAPTFLARATQLIYASIRRSQHRSTTVRQPAVGWPPTPVRFPFCMFGMDFLASPHHDWVQPKLTLHGTDHVWISIPIKHLTRKFSPASGEMSGLV